MARGGNQLKRVHYKGNHDDYFVVLDNVTEFHKWLKDSSVPLAHVLSSFQVFCTHQQGNQGTYDTASNADLDNEFGTHSETEVIEKVLREGVLTEGHMVTRNGFRNDQNGGWTVGANNTGPHQ